MSKRLIATMSAIIMCCLLLGACGRTVPEPGGYYITQIDPKNPYATGSLLGYKMTLHIRHATGIYKRWQGQSVTIYYTWGQTYQILSKNVIGGLVHRGAYQYRLDYKHDNLSTIYMPTDANLTINLDFSSTHGGAFTAVYARNQKDSMSGNFTLGKGEP